MLNRFDLTSFAKVRVVFKTLLVQVALLCAILFIVWGAQRLYALVDPVVFPDPVAVPDSASLTENEKGKILVDAVTHQLRRELDSPLGWSINDIVFNRYLIDNRAYRQYGVYHATKALIDLYSMHIAKIGSSGRESEFLYNARLNSFAINPRKFWFPAAEKSYRQGLALVEKYKKSLDDGTGVYNARTDDLYLALGVVIGENMLGYAIGLLEDAQNLPFDTLDNRIYEVQGIVLVARDFVHTLYGLYPDLMAKNNAENMNAAMKDMNAICTYNPLYITSDLNSGELVLSHLIFARNRLMDIRNSLRV